MPNASSADAESLWQHVGLEALREALARVDALRQQFETALRELPPCHACARLKLIERIQASGARLAGEAAGLSVLAGTLKETLRIAEAAQEELTAKAPQRCRCAGEPCTCHE